MHYMLLIYDPPDGAEGFNRLCEEEREAIMGRYRALSEDDACRSTGRLQPASTARTVRVKDGRTLTTDGPFAETKEQLGGYYVFEADDLDAAIEYASRIPVAERGGAVEVRPLVER